MGKIGIVFPGQGSQYVGMGKDLYEQFEEVRRIFEEAGDILNIDMKELCFDDPRKVLDQTVNTQLAVFTVNVAAYRVFEQEIGVKPFVMAGHSLGEYSALHAADAVTFADALTLVRARGRYQQEAVPSGTGCMAAVMGVSKETIETICREIGATRESVVEVATYNAPSQFVISGNTEAVEEALRIAKDRGAKRAVKLPISVPCHSSLLDEAARRFEVDMNTVTVRDGSIRVISNCDPSRFFSRESTRSLLTKLVNSPVRWQETVEHMIAMGVDTIIETGPKRTLSGLIKRIDTTVKTLNIEDAESLDKARAGLNDNEAINVQ